LHELAAKVNLLKGFIVQIRFDIPIDLPALNFSIPGKKKLPPKGGSFF
jgi:hypothetical protein